MVKKKSLIIISAVIVAILAVGFGLGIFFERSSRKKEDTDSALINESISVSEENTSVSEGGTSVSPENAKVIKIPKEIKNPEGYISAVKNFFAGLPESDEVSGYLVDLNGDGIRDIIYQVWWHPEVAIYDNGEFVFCDIDSQTYGGSFFPSGEGSGYFFDADKGIIVVRYEGHTYGTTGYFSSDAHRIDGTAAVLEWKLDFDASPYYENPEYQLKTDEDVVRVRDKFRAIYDVDYNKKIADYDLINYYDVCESADTVIKVLESEKDYAETIHQYHYDRVADFKNLGYSITGPIDYYYCVKDINSDGINELILSDELGEDVITGLYTICNGKVEGIFRQQRHGSYYINSDGYIEYQYKGLYIDVLNGKELESVYNSPSIFSSEGSENMYEYYKKENGFSTEYMRFDFIPYHFSE